MATQEMNLLKLSERGGKDGDSASADKSGIDLGIPFQADAIKLDLQLKTAELLSSTSIYEGQVVMTLPVSLFGESATSLSALPQSANGQFYVLNCPLLGTLADITLAQAEALLAVKKTAPAPPEEPSTDP